MWRLWKEAVVAARENAKQNGLENCEFIAGDVLKVLDEIEEKPDFIILDPPRMAYIPKHFPESSVMGLEKLVYNFLQTDEPCAGSGDFHRKRL